MVAQDLEEFKINFLLAFTRELIRNSADLEMYKLDRMVKREQEEEILQINNELEEIKKIAIKEKKETLPTSNKNKEGKKLVQERVKPIEEEKYIPSVKGESDEDSPFVNLKYRGLIKKNIPSGKSFLIPDLALPERLQYIKPLPTKEQIDLGKINNFIQDPVIRIIECNGPNKGVIISGVGGTKETNIVLTKEEIDEIMKKFSEETKIPLQEGLYKAVHGKLVLTAVYSESLGSKFVIKKMLVPPPRPTYLMNRGF